MSSRSVKPGKIDKQFDNELGEIIRERFGKGLDKPKPIGRATVQRKLIKLPEWMTMKDKLKNWTFLPDNKKGQLSELGLSSPTMNLFTFAIITFIVVLFFAGISYAMYILNDSMHGVGLANEVNAGKAGYVNMTQAAAQTFGQAYSAMDGLRLVSMAIVFSMILGTILVNAFLRINPVIWIVYVFISVFAIILAVPISNAYQNILSSGTVLNSYILQHSMANYVLLHLPLFVAAIGVVGSIFMFINILRGSNEETL